MEHSIALVHGTINPTAVRALLARHPLADGQAIYAVDVSARARGDAEISPERGFSYHPPRHSAGQPKGRRSGHAPRAPALKKAA